MTLKNPSETYSERVDISKCEKLQLLNFIR